MSWFQRNRIRLLVAGLLFFSLLLFIAHMKDRREQNWLDRSLLWLTSPIQHAIVWTIDGVANTWRGYVYLVGVEEENQLLKKQLDEAKRGNARLAELETENQRLRTLVNMQQVLGHEKIIAARVIGVNTSPVARTIRISIGGSAGVQIGDAVVSGVGLIGRVSTVVSGYATVRLIVDGSSAVDAVIRRSRARGIVRGQGEDEACSLDYLVRTADVTLKEKRKLVLVVRETPLHKGHLRLMTMAADMGAHILPPVPSFYHQPKTIDDIIDQTIGKIFDYLNIEHDLFRRWGDDITSSEKHDSSLKAL